MSSDLIEARARRMLRHVQASVGPSFTVEIVACRSQIGSGTLPLVTLPSAGLAIRPPAGRGGGRLEPGMIRKLTSGKYRLYSRKRDARTGRRKNLGTFGSRAAAEKHERAVQFFKHG